MSGPVVGWRIWNLGSAQLASWAVNYRWRPGENQATCLAMHGRACDTSPGTGCQCGFWAVWNPLDCVVRACSANEPPWHVLGLIAGWGTVAMHGHEGFRAERAALLCLFTDRPWAAATRPVPAARLVRWWRQALGSFVPPRAGAGLAGERHPAELQVVAARYGVPLVSLRSAVGLGLLGELGVPQAQVEQATRLANRTVAQP